MSVLNRLLPDGERNYPAGLGLPDRDETWDIVACLAFLNVAFVFSWFYGPGVALFLGTVPCSVISFMAVQRANVQAKAGKA